MPKTIKLENINIPKYSLRAIDRLPNISLGHGYVSTNNVLLKDVRLHSYVNNKTMSALDNYAEHENLHICITPLENDMFDDLAVYVFKSGKIGATAQFPMKIKDGKEGVREFFKELYSKVEAVVDKKTSASKLEKTSKFDDFMQYLENVRCRYDEWRINNVRKFVDKFGDSDSFMGVVADVLENVHFNKLYKQN